MQPPLPDEASYLKYLEDLEAMMDQVVVEFPALRTANLSDPNDVKRAFELLDQQRDTAAFWALHAGFNANFARRAIAEGNVQDATCAATLAERCRSMVVFKEQLEEPVWMAHSVRRLVETLNVWDSNQGNSDEEFWQLTFNENAYVLSQVFAAPMVFIKDKAYVGGMTLERTDSRFVDYLFSAESSREAILIEIKSPTTKLLGSHYRSVFSPSKDLAGSIVQASDYRAELIRNLTSLTTGSGTNLSALSPKCAVLIGNTAEFQGDPAARRSFELFRGGLKDIEVITYDELFRKVEVLAELFRLTRRKGGEVDASKSPPSN